MNQPHSKHNIHKMFILGLSWKEAVQDAERELRKARNRVVQLEECVRVFSNNMKSGVPFPGAEKHAPVHGIDGEIPR